MLKKIQGNNIIKDFGLNILASLILNIASQIIAYPYVSKYTSVQEYGVILLLMATINIFGVSLGNSLNNTRIIMQTKYDEDNINGDYNIIFLVLLFINIICTSITMFIFYKELNFIGICVVIISSLILFRAYYVADFRIELNYKKNLSASIFAFLGYIVGIFVAKLTHMWTMVFLFGELFACLYIFFKASIIRDKFQITKLFKISLHKYLYIMFAAFISSIMMYMDRFVIYSFLDSRSVSIFTVASYLGKTAGIIIGPIAAVLLSYYVKEFKVTKTILYKRFFIYTFSTLVIFIIIAVIGKKIIELLYPTIAPLSNQYFMVANLGTIIYILGNLIQPILLSYCHARWNLLIQVIYFILYIIISLFSLIHYELMGFCFAIVFVNILRALFMVFVILKNININNEEGDK